jgi:nucleotide-binding universal stress UspA family protein
MKRSLSSPPPRSILCPVDFSAPSKLALRAAAVLARRSGVGLTVLFVEDPLLSSAARAALHTTGFSSAAATELREFVQQGIGEERAGLEVEYAVATGNPAKEITKAASKWKSDLIVMGTQGMSGPRKMVFGSTTEAVLETATVPVLAVPPGASRLVKEASWLGGEGRSPSRVPRRPAPKRT